MSSQSLTVHQQYWLDLLENLESISWPRIISILMSTNHGFSNYDKCKKRDHTQVRQDVFEDEKIKSYILESPDNIRVVEKVLDEMCHLLAIQTTPTRKLKFAGAFFMKCITRIYSSIYVNTQLTPLTDSNWSVSGSFKAQFLEISKRMPIVILPTHRSYMDFLFITYVMFINELPLPVVAAGDNFKALGKILTDYLKATGAFLIRRNASNKRDIDANSYFDILRAYVQSIVKGGENPIEFFMEGTRTRLGQVLRPKTGLLSMVVDMYLCGAVEDICILPVSINYQRPMEEQLYVAETTPQISMTKPKESAKNLLAGLDKIMRRKYGKVYVRFVKPFTMSEYFKQWSEIAKSSSHGANVDKSITLSELTNSLASKVCLAQAYSNVLMPFNLITYSVLARTFLSSDSQTNGCTTNKTTENTERTMVRLPIHEVTRDFCLLEDLLVKTQCNFVAGWKSHLDILEEFKINRDEIIRASSDRKSIEFNCDAQAFHTFAYYSNQLMQILLPLAISSLLVSGDSRSSDDKNLLQQFKDIRALLSQEFLVDSQSLEMEFETSVKSMESGHLSAPAKRMILRHLLYFINSYLIFLAYIKRTGSLVKGEFFQETISENEQHPHFISKDMLNNMMNLVKERDICRAVAGSEQLGPPSKGLRRDEQLELQSEEKLLELMDQFQQVSYLIHAHLNLK